MAVLAFRPAPSFRTAVIALIVVSVIVAIIVGVTAPNKKKDDADGGRWLVEISDPWSSSPASSYVNSAENSTGDSPVSPGTVVGIILGGALLLFIGVCVVKHCMRR